MAQVIDLLSSSPALGGNGQTSNQQTAKNTAASAILSSSLWEDEEFDKPEPKRRRLSSISDLSPLPSRTRTTHREKSTYLDVLDDPWPHSSKHTADPTVRSKNNNTLSVGNGKWDDLDDPIICSSSPWLQQKSHAIGENRCSDVITIDDTVDDVGHRILGEDDDFDISQELPTTSYVSDKTARLLARIKSQSNAPPTSKPKATRKKTSTQDTISSESSDGPERPVTLRQKSSRSNKVDSVEKSAQRAAKAAERESAKLRQERERAAKKEEKRKLREEKEKQKAIAAGIAEANKSKMDKKVSLPEMIIDMATSFEDTDIAAQVTEYMSHVNVEVEFVPTQIPKVVSWRRKVTAEYDAEAAHWKPCPLTVQKETHVLCYMLAQEFVDLIFTVSDENLDSHLRKLRRFYPGYKPIYLVEGMAAVVRKSNDSRKQNYKDAFLRLLDENESSTSTSQPSRPKRGRKTRSEPQGPIDEDAIEDALLQLQVQHSCLVYHTNTAAETAEWIKVYTENISTIPYRQERMNLYDASFCMDVGQVKAGVDADDTYAKMLQEITRVTAPIAYGVANRYGSVSELVRAFKAGGPQLLEDVKVRLSIFISPSYSCAVA